MAAYLLYFSIFVGAILLVEAAAMAITAQRSRSGAINRRLRLLQSLPEGKTVLDVLRRERRLDTGGALSATFAWLHRLYVQSGVTVAPVYLIAVSAIGALAIALAARFLLPGLWPSVVIFIAAAVALPLAVLMRRRSKRINRFAHQLPNAIDIVVRSLRAGHPVTSSLSFVASEMPDPAGSEFGMVSDELTYGLEMDQAMQHLYERTGAQDLRLITTTINVQRATGGNLAEILEHLAAVIRERFQMRAKIKALSAEGRYTAWLMSAFPFAIFLILNLMMPTYYDPIWATSFAVPLVIFCLGALLVGDIILFRMVNFDF